uniref:ATP synthase complex subunit 8 n=1 Tax=Axianassa australis TaxID=576642 RepID=A0A4Y5QJQ7_9EUCA|nr:ATP synthase F0 subunit 8 [Axianassa australis]QCX31742.1 ATP synthase F0 subunit 8 [Axianassa australis]
MPQMAPLMWLYLLLFFILCFIVFIIMNYFSSIPPKMDTSPLQHHTTAKTWKW